jgi:hypothetical protein
MLAAAELFAIKSPVDISCFVCSSISSGEWISKVLYSGGIEVTSIMFLEVQERDAGSVEDDKRRSSPIEYESVFCCQSEQGCL